MVDDPHVLTEWPVPFLYKFKRSALTPSVLSEESLPSTGICLSRSWQDQWEINYDILPHLIFTLSTPALHTLHTCSSGPWMRSWPRRSASSGKC